MNAVCIYCKDCGALFFAAVKRPEVMKDAARYITKYLKQGYTIKELDVEQVRVEMQSCHCGKKP